MSCPIFRCQSINTLSNLDNSGKHNKREKDHYDSNSDIKIEESKNNIEIVKCNIKYREKFYEVTKEYRKEHEERMKNTRSDRKKSFSRIVDDSKSCVADEMVFTSDSDFFKDMTKNEILKWANTCNLLFLSYKLFAHFSNNFKLSSFSLSNSTNDLNLIFGPSFNIFKL